MAVQVEGQVGGAPNQYADGADPILRMGRGGELSVTDLLPRYYELTKRGYVYAATSPAVGSGNMAAANVSPLAAGTGQPLVGIYNPPASGVDLVILRAGVGTISGTPGGAIVWNIIPANAGITAAGVSGINAYTQQTGGRAKAFVNAALTGSVIATMYRLFKNARAVAAAAGEELSMEDVAGDIIVPPGGFAGLAVAAAGTTWVLAASLEWCEIPI